MGSLSGLTAKGAPPLPKLFTILRILVVVLSFAVLVASAYALSVFASNHFVVVSGTPGFMIFVVVKTWIIIAITFVLERLAPHLYFRILITFLLFLNVIFWLSGWAWSANAAAALLAIDCGELDCGPDNFPTKLGSAMAAAAALGAFTWVLMITNLALFCRACMADPYGSGARPPVNSGLNNGLGNPSGGDFKPYPQPYVAPVAPQAQYPPQQPYQQTPYPS